MIKHFFGWLLHSDDTKKEKETERQKLTRELKEENARMQQLLKIADALKDMQNNAK